MEMKNCCIGIIIILAICYLVIFLTGGFGGDDSTTDVTDTNDYTTVNLTKTISIDLEKSTPTTSDREFTDDEGEMNETTTKRISHSYNIQKDGYKVSIENDDDSIYKSIGGVSSGRLISESGSVYVYIEDSKGNIVQGYNFILTYKDGGSISTIKGSDIESIVDVPAFSDLISIEITPS